MPTSTIVPIEPVRAALIGQWAQLRSLAVQLTDAAWASPSILPGWSCGDIIAHVIGTESMLAGRPTPDYDVSGREHVRNPIGEFNEHWLSHYADQSPSAVLDAYDDVIAIRTAALTAMSQNDFDATAVTPAGPETYGRFMRIRTFDCWIHDVDLRDSMRLPAPTVAEPASWAIVEAMASMPYVVGKRAGAPSGTAVKIVTTGLVEQTTWVEVAERAAITDGHGATADVMLTVDAVEFARLIGGRATSDPTTVSIAGNIELGRAIIANLNYVI